MADHDHSHAHDHDHAALPDTVARVRALESLPDETRIRVWDSTAELRYLVVPMRPPGTEHMDAEALAVLVTRDAMIGTGVVQSPGAA